MGAVSRRARRPRGCTLARLEACNPLEHRSRIPRCLARAGGRSFRSHYRRLRDRVVQAGPPPLGGVRPADGGRARCACSRRRDPLPRHTACDRARTEDDLDQPAGRAAGTPPGRRAPLPERAHARARVAGARMNVRPITLGDYQAIVDLMIEHEEHLFGQASPLTVNDLREWLSRNQRETDSWLYEDDGEVCAAGWCDSAPSGEVAVGIGVVRPGWKGRGIGSELVTRSEATAGRLGVSRIHQFAMGADDGGRALFVARGYRDVRHFFSMAIELAERPDAPRLAVEP